MDTYTTLATSEGVDRSTTVFVYVTGSIAVVFAFYLYRVIASISLEKGFSAREHLLETSADSQAKLLNIYSAISKGADSFLFAEYRICAYFIAAFGLIVFVLTSRVTELECGSGVSSAGKDCLKVTKWDMQSGGLTALAFAIGAITSIISGYLGMKIAVFSNARTTVCALEGWSGNAWTDSFNTAFRAGGVMGFSLCGLALMVLYSLVLGYNTIYPFDSTDPQIGKKLFECIAGFGLGGSSIALFGRVGGGIYTKAADVGADLAGKVVSGIPEDDPRNPAVIADNVGDNVGDVAGMGSDLFGSFAEATCAALVIANSSSLSESWRGVMFPLLISGLGIIVCLGTSFVATKFSQVKKEADIERVLKVQLLVTTILMTVFLYPVAAWALPAEFDLEKSNLLPTEAGQATKGTVMLACLCVWCGLWSGCAIGFITEYYTSHSYRPTREVAEACETGAATNIIYGLALGYKSAVIPVALLSLTVFITFSVLDMYGVALSALGMLATLATCLSIDVYGPVCDNAGGIAEMSELPAAVREKTDALDAAGNTTAAIGKGFAIGSACLVGLALFGAFVKRCNLTRGDVSILSPTTFAFLLIGAMIPYWFSAMTMKSVGTAAKEMVNEVARQFREIPGLLEGLPGKVPDHAACIKISTEASLREMVYPGFLIILTPILTGSFFGVKGVCGLLAGAISSSVQMAISASNTGGAWDNAKKYVEKGELYIGGVQQKKGSECHKAAVVGDTVGDPLKDTSGPALNIVMKLMAILSLVFADFFMSINEGKGLIHWD